jgi:hypothetical protein
MKYKSLLAYMITLILLSGDFVAGMLLARQYGTFLAQGYMLLHAIAAVSIPTWITFGLVALTLAAALVLRRSPDVEVSRVKQQSGCLALAGSVILPLAALVLGLLDSFGLQHLSWLTRQYTGHHVAIKNSSDCLVIQPRS